MTYLDENTRTQVREALADLSRDVELLVYTGSDIVIPGRDAPGEQRATLGLLREVAELNDHLSVSERPIAGDEDAQRLGIELAPTIVFREAGSQRSNIRFVGLPAGIEFTTFITTLRVLGGADALPASDALAALDQLERDVRARVFVTPTCPYCPRAVLGAYRAALHSERVIAEAIEANEFPTTSQRYRISGVPDTVIEGDTDVRLLGAQPDQALATAILQAAGHTPTQEQAAD